MTKVIRSLCGQIGGWREIAIAHVTTPTFDEYRSCLDMWRTQRGDHDSLSVAFESDKFMMMRSGERFNPCGWSFGSLHASSQMIDPFYVYPFCFSILTRKSLEETFVMGEEILDRAARDGVEIHAYLAVSFECPYEGLVAENTVIDQARQLMASKPARLVIADTIGAANPKAVKSLMSQLVNEFGSDALGCHFHDTRAMGLANVYAALESGVRQFDSAAGGLGGCPFAPGAKGNGQACRRIVEFVDVYPTLTALADIPTPQAVEGRSLVPLLKNPIAKWDGQAITQVLRPADKRLAEPVMGRSIRTERWRYSDWGEGKHGIELYDHHADPMEFNNLALKPDKESKAVMKILRKALVEKASGKTPSTPFNPKRL